MNKKNVLYDKKSDSLYIVLKKGKEERFEEIQPDIMIEYNKRGQPIGIEILNASKSLGSFLSNEKNSFYQTSSK